MEEILLVIKIDEIIRKVPELRHEFVSAETLSGGLCNQTFKVQTKQSAYVLRINSKQNEYLNLTRRSEIEVMKKAHNEGLAPHVICCDEPETFIVTEFLEGRMPQKEDLSDIRMKEMIIERLKRVHRMEDQQRICTPYDLIHGYLKGADQLQVKQPDGLARLLDRVEKIAHRRSYDKVYNNKFCHNDSFLCNMIYSEGVLQLIDWELSGISDIFFELTLIPFTNPVQRSGGEGVVDIIL